MSLEHVGYVIFPNPEAQAPFSKCLPQLGSECCRAAEGS